MDRVGSRHGAIVRVPTRLIRDCETFHDTFAALLGFPEFYGRNMNAWIDCMTYLDEPPSGMTNVCIDPGQLVAIRIDDAPDFQRRCPEQYEALIECAAFVNHRRTHLGGQPVLTLMLGGWFRNPS
jgi:Barstar (barnase inhibitor)